MPESGLMTTTTMMAMKEPCIHLLFVMLHILKIPSDDIHLMVIPLPSSKAEFWIENYRNYRQSIRQSYTKNKKHSSTSLSTTSSSSNTAKSNENSPELSKFSEKLLLLNNNNNEFVSNTRLIIPQPIRHEQSHTTPPPATTGQQFISFTHYYPSKYV
ncbi:unnamed protein product [Trichobilharzia szidati]|nr:unnamed protein product [Trichobilharzia szidati]